VVLTCNSPTRLNVDHFAISRLRENNMNQGADISLFSELDALGMLGALP
jgi:hypothetical protein